MLPPVLPFRLLRGWRDTFQKSQTGPSWLSLIMASVLKTNKVEPWSYSIILSCGIQEAWACFEYSNFFQSKCLGPHGAPKLRASRGC